MGTGRGRHSGRGLVSAQAVALRVSNFTGHRPYVSSNILRLMHEIADGSDRSQDSRPGVLQVGAEEEEVGGPPVAAAELADSATQAPRRLGCEPAKRAG